MTEQEDAKGALRRVALAIVVVVTVSAVVSLFFSRRNSIHRMQRCHDQMEPLVAPAASAEAVGQRLGTSGEEFGRGRQTELVQRVESLGPSARTLAGVRQKAGQSFSSRLYMDTEEALVYVAFFDDGQHLTSYVCVEDHGD